MIRNHDVTIVEILAVLVIASIIFVIVYGVYYDATHECVEYKTVEETRCNTNSGMTRCWTEDVKVCDKYDD